MRTKTLSLRRVLSGALLLPFAAAVAAPPDHADGYLAPQLLMRSLGSGTVRGYEINNCYDLRGARLAINDRGEIAMISTCNRAPAVRDALYIVGADGALRQSRSFPYDAKGSRIASDDDGQFTYAINNSTEAGVYAFDPSLDYGLSGHRLLTSQPDDVCARHSPTRLPDDRARFVAERCAGSTVTSRAIIESTGMSGSGQMLVADTAWSPAGDAKWLSSGGYSANGWIGANMEHFPPGNPAGHRSVISLHPGQLDPKARSWGTPVRLLPGAVDESQSIGFGRQGDSASVIGNWAFGIVFLHFVDASNTIKWSAVPDLQPDVLAHGDRPPAVRRVGAGLHAVGSMRVAPVSSGTDVLVSMGARSPDQSMSGEAAWSVLLGEGDVVETDQGPARISRRAGGKGFHGDVVMNAGGDLVFVASLQAEGTSQRLGEGVFLMRMDRIHADGFD